MPAAARCTGKALTGADYIPVRVHCIKQAKKREKKQQVEAAAATEQQAAAPVKPVKPAAKPGRRKAPEVCCWGIILCGNPVCNVGGHVVARGIFSY